MQPRIAIYARVSTARQEQDETITAQISAIRDRLTSENLSIDESSIFTDEGYSGSLLERPALDRLKEAVRDNLYDYVYMYDYGRLSRNLSDLLLLKDDLERLNTKVISLHERISGDPDTDRLTLQMMGAVYEFEKKKIAKRFHNGKMQKAKKGKLVGYNAPYGYRYNKEDQSFEVCEHEAVVVKQMFEWVAYEQMSTYAVLQRLHELNIRPPKSKSEYWTRSPVARILSNQTYYGKHFYNKTEAILPRYRLSESKYRKQVKTGRRIRPFEDWIEIEVTPIIKEGLFNKAREQIARNVKFKPTNRKYDYLLTSLIKCTCGANRNADGPNGKKYYRCISRHRYFDRKNRCAVGGLNVPVTDSLVWERIKDLLSDESEIRKHAHRWLENTKTQNHTDNSNKLHTRRLKRLQEEEKRYVDAYGKGLIPEAVFAEKMKDVASTIKITREKLAKTNTNRGISAKISVDELVSKAQARLGKLEFKQKKFIIERVVEKIIAAPEEITICGFIPVPALATVGKVNFEPVYRNCRSTQRWKIDVVQCAHKK